MMSTITVDSSYVAAMKNKRFLLPLIKINIKHVKFEKLKEMLVNAVKSISGTKLRRKRLMRFLFLNLSVGKRATDTHISAQ